jgi:hypothetical protein
MAPPSDATATLHLAWVSPAPERHAQLTAGHDAANNTPSSGQPDGQYWFHSDRSQQSGDQCGSSSQVNLSWTDNSTNERGIKVERATSRGPWSQIATTGPNITSYSSTGCSASTTYYYRVRATNTAGDSAYSNIASATTPPQSLGNWSSGFGGTGNDFGYAVAYDSSGDLIVTGEVGPGVNLGGGVLPCTGSRNPVLAKFTAAGAHMWSQCFAGGLGSGGGTAVAVDPNGNILVTGNLYGTVDFGGGPLTSAGGFDIFVAQYTATGAHMWSKRFGGTTADAMVGETDSESLSTAMGTCSLPALSGHRKFRRERLHSARD